MNKKIVFILFSFCNIFADEEITQEGINDRKKTNEGDSTPNLGSKEDFLDYKDLNNSRVEENVLTNKNNWNTRKWGSIYFLFPHLTYWSIYHKFTIEENIKKTSSFIGPIERKFLRILNFILSGIVEYKWMFHKYCGINVRLNLNNIEAYYSITKTKDCVSFFSLDISFEWIYRRKNKHVWSGSFSPIGLAFVQAKKDFEQMFVVKDNINHKQITEDDIEVVKFNVKIGNKLLDMWTFGFVLLKYEYGNVFYMNLFKIKGSYFAIYHLVNYLRIPNLFNVNQPEENPKWEKYDFGGCIFFNGFSMEFGLNIIGFYDWIKRKIKK